MRLRKVKSVLAAAAILAMAGGGLGMAATSEPVNDGTGMPNPIVEYGSYHDLKDKVGFEPLFIPKIAGYRCDRLAAIGNDLAEMDYGNNNGATFSVRTAKADVLSDENNISGIYGAHWVKRQVGTTEVYIAKVGDSAYAAYWQSGDYAFSASADQVTEPEFMRVLSNGLIDLTEHFYGNSTTLDARRAYF